MEQVCVWGRSLGNQESLSYRLRSSTSLGDQGRPLGSSQSTSDMAGWSWWNSSTVGRSLPFLQQPWIPSPASHVISPPPLPKHF